MNESFLKLFVEIADSGSITRSAKALGYSQGGLSHAINRAEEALGFKLFVRQKSGVALTDAGERLLLPAREAVFCYEKVLQSIDQLRDISSGRVTIGTFTSISMNILPPVIARFNADFPSIELRFFEGSVSEIQRWIVDRTVDIGITSLHDDDIFESRPWFNDRYMAVLPKDAGIAADGEFPLEDIERYPFIMPGEDLGHDSDIENMFAAYGIRPRIRLSTKSTMAIFSMVESGLGISVLPELITLKSHDRDIITVPIKPHVSRTIGLGMRSLEGASLAAKKFIQYAESYVDIFSDKAEEAEKAEIA